MRIFPSILIQLMAFWLILAGTQIVHAAYKDMGDGTVYDEERSLLWQKSDDGVKRNFADALSYCNDLSLGDRENWQLPSAESLSGLVDKNFSPTINPVFPSQASEYFSSRITTAIKQDDGYNGSGVASGFTLVRMVDFNNGNITDAPTVLIDGNIATGYTRCLIVGYTTNRQILWNLSGFSFCIQPRLNSIASHSIGLSNLGDFSNESVKNPFLKGEFCPC